LLVKSTLLVLLFVANISICFSQTVDSLRQVLDHTKSEHKKVDLWNEISRIQLPISGKEAAQNALILAKQIKYIQGEADANYYLGSFHYLKDKQDLAEKHMLNAIALYDSADIQNDKAETLIFLGEIHYFNKDYSTALKRLQEAENIAIDIKDKLLLGLVYETKSLIFDNGLKDKKLGESYILKSNEIFKEIGHLNLLIDNYLRIATFYLENDGIDNAFEYINKGESILGNLDKSKENARIYLQNSFTSLKGSCYAKIGQLDTAKLFIEESLPFFIENENWYSVAWSYTDLSIIALNKGNFEEAVSYAKKSIDLDATAFSIEDNIKVIKDAYKQLNQDSFHLYNERFIELIADTKNVTQINEIQEVIKKEEINKKEKELVEEKSISRYILIGMLLLSILYAFSLLFYYKKAKKGNTYSAGPSNEGSHSPENEIEIDELRQKVHTIERSLLSKEIDLERQRNSIDNTSQYLKEIAGKKNPAELKKSLQELSNQLEYNRNSTGQWEFFTQQFEQIHPNFFNKLRQETPNLSNRELRLCAYGRLGMTNQEIAQTLGIATSSVSKARHRLKKKMNLGKEQDLNQFLTDL